MKKITLSLGDRSYDIVIGHELIRGIGKLVRAVTDRKDAIVISNERLLHVYKSRLSRALRAARIRARFITIPDSERAKSIKIFTEVVSAIAETETKSSQCVIAFGGGVVGDLSGFVSSVYKRGIPLIHVPTTLLAQVDSAIGGKTGLDLPVAKNLIGSFYQPRLVVCDVCLLKTLPARQVRSGFAEIVKYAIIKDPELFRYLEKHSDEITSLRSDALEKIVSLAASIKARIVESDEYDCKDKRIILNFGHTIGHAIEAASAYSGLFSHGEAVAIGMIAASHIAVELRMLSSSACERIESLIKKLGLPTTASGVTPMAVFSALLHDKKFVGGRTRFVLPRSIGTVTTIEGVPDCVIRNAIKDRLR